VPPDADIRYVGVSYVAPTVGAGTERSMPSNAWMTSGEGHPRRWAILAVLVVSLLVVVLDNTILNIALPTIQRDLNASQSELVWAIDSYILAFASLLFTWGVIGDRVGRKRVLIIGLVIFGLGSAACAFAESSGMLIAFRTIMGVGGAAVMPTTLAIITVVFPPHERGKAIGAWAGAVGAAVALGPVLGGILLEHPEWSNWLTGNDWGSVFLINVPIVIVGLFFIWRVVPETRNPHPRRLDVPGLLISAGGLILLVYGIINASSTRDWLAPSVALPMAAGIILIAFFLWTEARSDHASFDVSLFRNRGYAVSLTAVSLAFFAMSGVTFSLPFYFQVLRGYTTLVAGLCFLPFAIGQLIAAPRSAAMVKRFGYRIVMTTGLVVVSVSMLLLALVPIDAPLWALLVVFFLFGFGMGNVIAPGSTVLQNVLPLARAGAGSAVQNTVRQVAGALGVAIVGTVLATQYAANLTSVLDKVPPTFPDAAKQAATESVVAADQILDKALAQGAPAALIEQMRNGAYEAFLSASHVTSWISFVVIVIAALVVGFLLPQITPPERGDRAVGAPPADAADALVKEEMAHYAEEAAEEYDLEAGSTRDGD
jgi:MFS transporter, DHA2 family, multidrug resistance protein